MHICCNERSATGRILSEALGCTFGPNIPAGETFVVSYGRGYGRSHVNNEYVGDKMNQLLALAAANVPCPQILEIDSDDPAQYPIMLRKRNHTRGKDIKLIIDINERNRLLRGQRPRVNVRDYDFIVKYIDKVAEYRVHFIFGHWVSVSTKTRVDESKRRGDYVWSHNLGWVHNILPKAGNEKKYKKLIKLALRAAEVLKFDFGAVDIMEDREGDLYVLEINAAPGLNERRAEIYARRFRERQEGPV